MDRERRYLRTQYVRMPQNLAWTYGAAGRCKRTKAHSRVRALACQIRLGLISGRGTYYAFPESSAVMKAVR